MEEMVEGKPPLTLRFFIFSCKAAGKVLKAPSGKDEGLRKSLEFLGLGVEEGEVKVLALLSSLLFFFLSLPFVFLPCGFLLPLLSPLIYAGVKGYPRHLAEGERRRRAGEVPLLLSLLSTSLLLNPNLEVAGEFAARNTRGRMGQELGRELSRVFLRVHREAGGALRALSRRWGDPPELVKPLLLLLGSVSAGEEDRRRAVEQALEDSLETVRGKVGEFVDWVRFPLLLLYSFGVLLPLCLLTLFPVLATLGLFSSPLPLAFLYCVLLPLSVYSLSSWILSRRPGVSLRPELSPERGKRYLLTFLLPPSLFPLLFLLPSPEARVLGLLWSLVLALSLHLFLTARGKREDRRRLLELEESFPEVLWELGSELRRGKPMEGALRKVEETCRVRALTFQGGGSSSSLVEVTLSLLRGLAERSGRAAGVAAMHLSSHLRRLREVERRGRQEMAELSSSMRSVALFFSPFISSLTCQMYAVLCRRGKALTTETLPPSFLLLLLGVYTLVFSSLLLSLGSEMEGGDGLEKRMQLASGLLLSLFVFTLGTVGGSMLLGWFT